MELALSKEPLMIANPSVSIEEQEQILQTIEMFEVITQANPNDSQSLEVLKEAYSKIGESEKAIAVTRRLADTYVALGQYASAIIECQVILRQNPENTEAAELLAELESKLNQPGAENETGKKSRSHSSRRSALENDATLMRTGATVRPEGEDIGDLDLGNDGNDPLAKFLSQHKLVDPKSVETCLERVRRRNQAVLDSGEPGIAHSLIGELCESNAADLDTLLCGILDRTKLAYVPLEYYDIDRQIVKMLPESLTLSRLVVPFDLISRTVMIAMANPFDSLGKEAVQQLFDYNIQWHVASPEAIAKTLAEVYRIDRGGKR